MTRSRLDRTRRAVEAAASREGFALDPDQSALLDRLARQRFIAVVDVLVDADVELVVTSPHDLATFRGALPDRPDTFRMTSRLLLLAG
ncbi:hypothetical protein [Cellulosimicrobium cellulans]|uniref:hypothetical protein n=1 Tax=Cellulosimicrobium cellulans TaxID=1710 RepID=UPI002404DCE0|nr:hypothetical protein [Cellulosimicrobium cellulans]MDF9878601.1 putative ATPase [Cellulosimicrobium cellulans]